MEIVQSVFISSVSALTLTAAVTDLRTRKLPNWLTVSAFVAGVLFHATLAPHATVGQGLTFSLLGFALGFGVLFVLWLTGGGGAGDVKLMGAIGAWFGWKLTLYLFVISTLLVAVGGLSVMAYHLVTQGWGSFSRRYFTRQDVKRSRDQHHKRQRRLIPYALPVAVGVWLVLLWMVLRHPAGLPY